MGVSWGSGKRLMARCAMCGEVVKRLKFTAFFTDSHAMSSALSIASSGMQAAQLRLGQSAHNVANLETPGFRRLGVEQQALPDGQGVQAQTRQARAPGAALESDAVEQMAASYAFKANAVVLRTASHMLGTLLDEYA